MWGLILTGGRSSRMGRTKALLEYRGSPFLMTFVSGLSEAGIGPVTAVGGVHTARIRERLGDALAELGVDLVENPDPDRGMFSSVQVGVEAFRRRTDAGTPRGLMICLIDHPGIRTSTYREMTAALDPGSPRVIIPTLGGRRGHPLLLSAHFVSSILERPPTDSLRDLIQDHSGCRYEVEVDDPAIHRDVDTPEDLAVLEKDPR